MKAYHKTLFVWDFFLNIYFKDFGFTLESPYRHIAQHVGIKNNKIYGSKPALGQ
jgi:hypothetical protein